MSMTINSPDKEQRPTIFSANLLYLVSMILILTVGVWMQNQALSWGLIGTELLLILLPTLIWLRRNQLPVKATMRVRWPGGLAIILAVIIGVGVWLLDVFLSNVMEFLLGYTVPTPPAMFPTTIGQAALLFIALAVVTPVCEESLFRGYILPAYEPLGPRRAILAVALLFAMYHLTLSGFVALLPVALVLCYLAWRSQSLIPAIALHATNNALAVIYLTVISLKPEWVTAFSVGLLVTAVIFIPLTFVALWQFNRRLPKPLPAVSLDATNKRGFKQSWPLVAAVLIFIGLGTAELVMGRFPQVLAFGQPLQLPEAPWDEPVTWHYEVRNVIDQPIGEARCQLTPQTEVIVLDCQMAHDAYDVEKNGRWISAAAQFTQTTQWQRDDLTLLVVEESGGLGEFTYEAELAVEGDHLAMRVQQGDLPAQTLSSPHDTLLMNEWPWRLSALPFGLGYSREVTVLRPNQWREETQDTGPLAENTNLFVSGGQPVHTPAGDFITWQVTVGDETAWYDIEPPHTLVQYSNRFVTYVLVP